MNFKRRVAAVLVAAVSCALLATVGSAPAMAAGPAGGPDLSFGSCGVRRLASMYAGSPDFLSDTFTGVAVQPDGRIVLAMTRSLTRLLPDGLVDRSFGVQGLVETSVPDHADLFQSGVTIQPDGRILVGGRLEGADSVLSRYLADGRLDPSFGRGGHLVGIPGPAIILQPDGRMLSWYRNTVARITPGGALDPTFGVGGRVVLADGFIHGIGLQPNGKVVVSHAVSTVPEQRRIIRLAADGTPDTSFGTGGAVVTQLPAEILVDSEGRTSWTTYQHDTRGWRLVLHRLLPSGQPDPAVDPVTGDDFVPAFHTVKAQALQADGRIVVAASSRVDGRFGLFRLGHDGHLDRTYGAAAGSAASVHGHAQFGALARTPAGDWLLAGSLNLYDLRPVVVKYRDAPDPTATAPTLATCTRSIDTSFHQSTFPEVPLGLGSPPATFTVRSTGTATVNISRVALLHNDPGHFAIRSDRCTGVSLPPGTTCTITLALTPKTAERLYGYLAVWDDADDGIHTVTLYGRGRGPLTPRGWGWDVFGQIGDGSAIPWETDFATFPGAVALSAGFYHSIALRPDGTVWASGWNGFGQLGDGSTTERQTPTRVVGLSGVVAISAGAFHSLALTADGSVWAWGLNNAGQLGDGTTVDRSRPVRVGVTPVASVSAGGYHSLAVASDGTALSWGWNALGQLGDGTTTSRSVPGPVSGVGFTRKVAAGAFHSLALLEDDSVAAWGWNALGQLGDGTTVSRHQPVTTPLPRGTLFIAAGAFHSLAAGSNGGALAWGWNRFGQLGDGSTTDRLSPVAVALPVTGPPGPMGPPAGTVVFPRAISAGGAHSLFLGEDGQLWSWGWNGLNQVDPSGHDAHVPGAKRLGVSLVAAGWYHSFSG